MTVRKGKIKSRFVDEACETTLILSERHPHKTHNLQEKHEKQHEARGYCSLQSNELVMWPSEVHEP
jgi:hypothetical protein